MAEFMVIVPGRVVECGEPDSVQSEEFKIEIVADSWIGAANKFVKSLQDLADRAELASQYMRELEAGVWYDPPRR